MGGGASAPAANLTGQNQPDPKQPSIPSNPEWVNTIVPENLRGEKFWATIKDPADLAVKHAELVRYQGRSIAVPAADAKPEEWDKVFAKLGRPESADKYELKHDSWPKDVTYNEALEKGAREQFHKLGLTARQAGELYNWYLSENISALSQQQEAAKTRYNEGVAALDKEWGANAKAEFGLAQSTLMRLVDGNVEHPLIKWLDSTGETNNPVLIKFFNDLGKKLGEDPNHAEDDTVAENPQEEVAKVDKEIADMRADPKSAYNDVNHPGHKAAVEEMYKKYQKRNELIAGG